MTTDKPTEVNGNIWSNILRNDISKYICYKYVYYVAGSATYGYIFLNRGNDVSYEHSTKEQKSELYKGT